MKKIHWGVALLDISIVFMAVAVSVWQDNPNYLWMMALALITGSLTMEDGV